MTTHFHHEDLLVYSRPRTPPTHPYCCRASHRHRRRPAIVAPHAATIAIHSAVVNLSLRYEYKTVQGIVELSRLSIIVFSENYATSSWCLSLMNLSIYILEWKRVKYHLVWPIYYKVEPSDVWHQRNSYAKAMAAHENRLGKESEKVQKWKSALSEVANLEKLHFETGYATVPVQCLFLMMHWGSIIGNLEVIPSKLAILHGSTHIEELVATMLVYI
ncbi:hypothetical protein RIF29_17957 [Crotalaria pallida]|uniref:TIR domain-containing protein n=1 Tax=Crotalaria pallida TaxID=3830 RepID=A0AAN9FLD1_CROPI